MLRACARNTATAKRNTMRADVIASVAVNDGHLIYTPTPRFIALGMTQVDLGADTPDARRQVVALNFDARQRKKAAKEAKLLERADAIRARQVANDR
jgi:hypothetical protein